MTAPLRPLPPRRTARLLIVGLGLLAMPAAAPAHGYDAGAIHIGHPWSRATPPGARTGAGYFAIENSGAETDRLVSAASPAAERVEIHEMRIVDGVMNMRHLDAGLEIPANGSADLAPGGYHLMLVNIRAPFREGERVPVTLTFERAGAIEVELQVDAMGARGPAKSADGGADGEAHAH